MKNIFNTSKRGIIVILTLCILLSATEIGVYAVSMPEENTVVNENPTVLIEENTSELVPVIAKMCSENYSSKFLGTPDTTISDTSVAYPAFIHFDSFGIADYIIHFTDHGTPSIHTNPHYHTFTFKNGWWTPNVYHSGLPN